MIKKILIANRGEIACRVMKSAHKLGIATVAVYSQADTNAQHVKMANEAVYLGEAPATKSYLNGDLIIQKAKSLGVDAIHPGYGFLSENANFADKCEQNGIIFIGPNSSAIRAMGSKSAAKTIMEAANVPLVPGYHGDNQDPSFLRDQANAMGYPVLLKAAAGGGGKGMRQVWQEKDFFEALDAAKREAMNGFGDDIMLVEKYLTEPRHVEIQVFCDNFGKGVYLFERDCSVQRRHQKIIEEAPAPGMTGDIRQQMGEAALKAAHAIGYTNAGTVEFLLDSDGAFYFMEMNTRLQVEHPVTEFITGEDLVEWQIAVANNLPLPKSQDALSIKGHAFEARIYAEDPHNEFLPSTGLIEYLLEPPKNEHVRIDSGVVSGDEVSIYYDPMIAKLVVWAENRDQALALLITSLQQYMICGVTTNIPYLIQVASSEPFRKAILTTDFIERHGNVIATNNKKIPDSVQGLSPVQIIAVSAMLSLSNTNDVNHNAYTGSVSYPGFRLNHTLAQELEFAHGDNYHRYSQKHIDKNTWSITINDIDHVYSASKTQNVLNVDAREHIASYPIYENDDVAWLLDNTGELKVIKPKINMGTEGEKLHAGDVLAPMNGTLVAMNVKQGQRVEKDDLLAVVEAMKMEHSMRAPFAGTVSECFGNKGDLVDGGQVLVSLKADLADSSAADEQEMSV
ncbi:methylcrotonoyl-CoA carboxylase subunit alpha, mitochondrial [Glaciecola punicea ACAM 611]|uniref:Biotin carboxylase n=1 Tax=Glaciecola punicea ACAM 611 TaxID=1121923 RepID=H5T9D1_9ALTE|nr:acetyl/propionyl/methylcrotonyl-CoA carboxylase subunit alpha [Glaciecola punicea]OFA33180.1 3-methylcrotonyl-CoA carboxylase [Glaciecola punicea]GAB54908.1 methylcrotonoyl-CoA carboxylase subunit alpha, mitochondrial [Glaciecola punicea ACAM 611]